MFRTLRPALLAGALLIGLSACKQANTILIPSDDPELNLAKFTQVEGASANTKDFKAEVVSSSLAPAPGQDFLTLNASPGLADTRRLFNLTLHTKADQIKAGATFPMSLDATQGTCAAIYQETSSIITKEAYQASSGTLVIDKITGTTILRVEFHIKDAKMVPAKTSNGEISKGSFVFNMHGSPTQ